MNIEEQNTLKAEEDDAPLVDVSTELKLGTGEDGKSSAGDDDDELSPDEPGSTEENDKRSAEEDDELSSDEVEDKVFCYCGRAAKRRISRTDRNPGRKFYNCSNWPLCEPCGFFLWYDELFLYRKKHANKHVYGVNSVCSLCIQLGNKIESMEQQINAERTAWYKERTELTLMLSHKEGELEEIKKRVKLPDETDCMPPDVKNVKQENGIKKRVKEEELYESDHMPPADKKVKQEDDVKDEFNPLPPMIKKVKQEDEY